MQMRRGLLLCVGGLLAGRLALLGQTPVDSAAGRSAAVVGAPATATAPAARLKPETEEALLLGEKALNEKKYDEAIKEFKRGIKIESDRCSRCYVRLAEAQAALRDEKGALNSSDKAITVAVSDAERADAHAAKALTIMHLGDAKILKDAETEYKQAIQLAPKSADNYLGLAVALFKQSRDVEGQEQLAIFLKMMPNGAYAEYARKLQANPRRAREEFAPDFQVTTIKGQTVSSADFRGKVLVLDFWATWCPPCRASVPEIKELTRKYPSDKLVVLSVSADKDDKQWREFIEKKNMDWLQYRDEDGHVLRAMGVHAFPTYLVIDTEGVIRERIVGENPQQSISGKLKDKLQKMLPQG
jgi:peroxiredoxin